MSAAASARVVPPVWTADEDAALVARAVDQMMTGLSIGAAVKAAAAEIGRPAEGALFRAKKQGFYPLIRRGVDLRVQAGVVSGPVPMRAHGGGLPSWSRDEDNLLCQMHREGWPLDRIGEKLGRSSVACRSRVAKLRREGRYAHFVRPAATKAGPWSLEEEAHLRVMYAQGLRCVAICERLGRSKNAVQARARRLGLLGLADAVATQPAKQKSDKGLRGTTVEAVIVDEVVAVPDLAPVRAPVPMFRALPAVVRRGPPPIAAVLDDALPGQKRAAAEAHLAWLGYEAPWRPDLDLVLCDGIWRGFAVAAVAAECGVMETQAVARFRAITGPFRDDRGRLPIGTERAVMPVLQARAAGQPMAGAA